jgi:4-diphosphocytidyl-2-C-methyl-D-erythritol kinase
MNISTCNSKINLSLRILNKREDGYHNIRSNVIFTDICDQIIIKIINVKEKKIKLEIQGQFARELQKNIKNNLIYKAVNFFYKEFGIKNNITIILNKNLPIASGIGGGSSNAACILKMLPKVFKIRNNKKLKSTQRKIALKLGSDIVACMHSKPLKMQGKGDKISNIDMHKNFL